MEDVFKQMGLKFSPFPIATDIRYYYWTVKNKIIIEELYYGIKNKKGFMVLIGEAGLGKTSLSLQLLSKLEQEKIPTAWIFNTILNQEELFSAILNDFGLSKQDSICSMQSTLHDFFLNQHKQGTTSVILIDEAQNLDFECLESLRMLSNLEWEGEKLVQIVFVGQPEFIDILNQPKLRQLRSRITILLELSPFTLEETKEYVNFKLISAHASIKVTDSAFKLLFKVSKGNIRIINLIMERCCYALFVKDKHIIDKFIMLSAIKDISNFHKDISIKLKKIYIKKIFFGSLIFTILGILILIIFLKLNVIKNHNLFILFPKNNTKSVIDINRNKTKYKNYKIYKSKKISNRYIKKSINLFLRPLNLEKFSSLFYKAVQNKNINLFKESIKESISEKILFLYFKKSINIKRKNNWSIFPWKKYTGQEPAYIVIWKPRISILSDERKLKRKKLYKLLLKSYSNSSYKVIVFEPQDIKYIQKKYNLPITGKIDLSTLFFIEQESDLS